MVQPDKVEEPAEPSGSPKAENPPKKPSAPKGYAFLFKYVMVGDCGVGKTALLHRFTQNSFVATHVYTIGVDFAVKTVELANGDEAKLQMWDTAGQERFRNITRSYYRGAHAVIIVYDVTDKESYDNVQHWLQEARDSCNDDVVVIVVGTKTDLPQKEGEERYGREELVARLEREGQMGDKGPEVGVMEVYEASSKTGEGVDLAFKEVTDRLMNQRLDERNPLRGGMKGRGVLGHEAIRLGQDGKKPKKRCC